MVTTCGMRCRIASKGIDLDEYRICTALLDAWEFRSSGKALGGGAVIEGRSAGLRNGFLDLGQDMGMSFSCTYFVLSPPHGYHSSVLRSHVVKALDRSTVR
jgi:hypothetical protein